MNASSSNPLRAGRSVAWPLICALIVFTPVNAAPPDPGPVNVIVKNSPQDPVPVRMQYVVEDRIIGFSNYEDSGRFEFEGLVGIPAMHRVCQFEFGPGAHAASVIDLFTWDNSVRAPESAWLVPEGPINVLAHRDTSGNVISYFPTAAEYGIRVGAPVSDEFGAANLAYCQNYRSTHFPDVDTRAPAWSSSNGYALAFCSDTKPVVCAAPVAVPVAY